MTNGVHGIHHVTAIAGDPRRNLDFYTDALGLRFVKKTVNHDDPATYHLYYGDGEGNPGSIITFFPWADAPTGRVGTGQLAVTAFSVPRDSIGYWSERLIEHGARFESPYQRFGDTVLRFADPDGMPLELVGTEDERQPWGKGGVPSESAIRGFHHVALSEKDAEGTLELMTGPLGFRSVEEENGRTRLAAGEGGPGDLVDVVEEPEGRGGRMGVGTVHHVAFRVPDEESQSELRQEIASLGYKPTPIIDRVYFSSVYFREPGGVLFEIATDPPGFAIDEDTESLGEALMLPPWLEKRRAEIEELLPPLGEEK